MTAEAAIAKHFPPRRILIVLMGAIGDVVRALPLLGRIRSAWPQVHVAWAIEPKSRPIVEGHPWLDEVIVYERGRPWSYLAFLARVRAGRFDLVLDLQRHLKSGLVAMASGASERIGFSRDNAKECNQLFATRQIEPQPALKLKLMQYQAFADVLGLAPAPIAFGLKASAAERERALAMLTGAERPMLGVILGSSWPSRLYFPDSLAAAIRLLAKPSAEGPGLFPVLFGAGEDVAFAEQVIAHLGDARLLNLAGRTTLRDLVPMLGECAAAFGPDSGPMHIAAAVGCPVVSLWGSTAPQRSAPWGFAEFALAGKIPCHPCYRRCCPIGRECMRRITPAQVAAMVRQTMAARSARCSEPDRIEDHRDVG